jgi:hypothetical protein
MFKLEVEVKVVSSLAAAAGGVVCVDAAFLPSLSFFSLSRVLRICV